MKIIAPKRVKKNVNIEMTKIKIKIKINIITADIIVILKRIKVKETLRIQLRV